MRNFFKVQTGFLLFFCLLGFISCKSEHPERLNLYNQGLEWCLTDADSSVTEVMEHPENYEFQKLLLDGRNNLLRTVKKQNSYIWIKLSFTVPQSLKNKDMALFITKLLFADQAYLNGKFIGNYGRFTPNELNAGDVCHFYPMFADNLKQDEENIILLKVLCKGNAEISNKVVIGEYSDIRYIYGISNFYLSILYLFFEGAMLILFFLYLFLFITNKKRPEYMMFSLMNFYTAQFSFMFFAPLLPWYQNPNFNYLSFVSYFGCLCFFTMFYFVASFMDHFLQIKRKKRIYVIRLAIVLIQIIILSFIKSIDSLSKVMNILLALSFIQFIPTIKDFFMSLISKKDKALHRNGVILLVGMLPFFICLIADFILRLILNISDLPYYSYYGWLATLTTYLIILAVRYGKVVRQNEYLNENLKGEIEIQTQEYQLLNKKLETEVYRNKEDLKMAFHVQKKIFENPISSYLGWDIAVSYEPLSSVSGDMYDIYNVGHILNGFSIFDVSGHGIAASLITMLSKNIISRNFLRGIRMSKTMAEIMTSINDEVIHAKGEAENYMTGLLFQINPSDAQGSSRIEFTNAGHPYPILYRAHVNKAENLESENSVNRYGAIGIKDMPVSFQNSSFSMAENDVLVCFTDGLIESTNTQGKQMGQEAILRVIEENHQGSAAQILKALQNSLNEYLGNEEREDDVTIIVLKKEAVAELLEEL